jgi:hypothetical protein
MQAQGYKYYGHYVHVGKLAVLATFGQKKYCSLSQKSLIFMLIIVANNLLKSKPKTYLCKIRWNLKFSFRKVLNLRHDMKDKFIRERKKIRQTMFWQIFFCG